MAKILSLAVTVLFMSVQFGWAAAPSAAVTDGEGTAPPSKRAGQAARAAPKPGAKAPAATKSDTHLTKKQQARQAAVKSKREAKQAERKAQLAAKRAEKHAKAGGKPRSVPDTAAGSKKPATATDRNGNPGDSSARQSAAVGAGQKAKKAGKPQ